MAAPVVLLGETIDVAARSARTVLRRAPGRNLAVLGTRVDEACAVLGTAARSLAAQFTPGAARFSVACLDTDASAAVDALRADLPPGDTGFYDTDRRELAAGGHRRGGRRRARATGRTSSSCTRWTPCPRHGERLRRILRQGPERRIHVLGWWRGAALLRDTLGGQASRTDADRRVGGAGRARQRAGAVLSRARARRPGIRGRGGRCISTARCTAAPR